MKDKKFFTSQEEYELYKQGYPAMAIEADSYYGLIKEHGKEMIGLNVLVKVRPHEDRGEMDYIFGQPVLKGWHKIRKH